jgi:small subunit ribosomal protein S17
MAEESEQEKKPAEKAKPAAHEKEAVPKVHRAPEAAREHHAAAEYGAHEKEAPKDAKEAKEPGEHREHKEHKEPKAAPVRPEKPPVAKKRPAAPLVAKAPKPKVIGKTDIGIDAKPPARACTDQNCPFHGRLPVRGQIFEGEVVADGMDKSAVIRRERLVFIPKYERYLKRTSRMSVHSPPCIDAKVGDQVTVMECRPLSKTISFTIVSKRAEGKVPARTE